VIESSGDPGRIDGLDAREVHPETRWPARAGLPNRTAGVKAANELQLRTAIRLSVGSSLIGINDMALSVRIIWLELTHLPGIFGVTFIFII
jgi:hypothetical protein